MILKKDFYDWLVNKKGLKDTVAKVNVARIVRINNVYDIEKAYTTDKCAYLLLLFDYSKTNADDGLLPDHDIIIVGNYYTGTQSLKYALKHYVEFLNATTDYPCMTVEESLYEDDEELYDVADEEFEELLGYFREMGSTTMSVKEMLDEPEDDETSDDNNTNKTMFMGSFQDFLRYVGPFCKNYVNSITRAKRKSHSGICEYCGKKAILDSAHKDGEDRPIIINKILDANFKKGNNYYEVDIEEFEKMFKDAHLPVEDHIFFLCKECHGEYDRGTKITTADILAKRSITKVTTD